MEIDGHSMLVHLTTKTGFITKNKSYDMKYCNCYNYIINNPNSVDAQIASYIGPTPLKHSSHSFNQTFLFKNAFPIPI